MFQLPHPTVMMMQGGLNPFTIGNTTVPQPGDAQSTSSDIQTGAAYLATENGIVNFMTIRGNDSGPYTVDYRMCIYAATSQTVWSGALLGQTAIQNSLGLNEVHKAALLAPVNIVAGNWYALTIQVAPPGMTTAEAGGYGDRYFADVFSNGAELIAGASALNSNEGRCIWASTV